MKTFDEVKEDVKTNEIMKQQSAAKMLEQPELESYMTRAYEKVIQDTQTYMENLDEVTTITIGATTNSLIKGIQDAYKLNLTSYWQNFEGFMREYIIGISPDGKLQNGMFYGQNQCYELGIGLEELLCLKGKDPLHEDNCDLLRQLVNTNFGTNIPMAGVEAKALKDFEEVAFGSDTESQDRTLIHLKEVQRDAGTLKNGGMYYLLATNPQYQEAKQRCAEKTI